MDSRYIYIITRDELVRLDCSKVVYMVGDGNYTDIVLVNKQNHSICMNLSQQQLVSESLREQASSFVRIGKRFIVNLSFVYKVQPLQKNLVLTDGVNFAFKLGISKEALKQLKALLLMRVTNSMAEKEPVK